MDTKKAELKDKRLIDGKCCGGTPYLRGEVDTFWEYQCVACGRRYYEEIK